MEDEPASVQQKTRMHEASELLQLARDYGYYTEKAGLLHIDGWDRAERPRERVWGGFLGGITDFLKSMENI